MSAYLKIAITAFLLSVIGINCSKSNPASPPPATLSYVSGALFQANGNAVVMVELKIGSSTGNVISGATVLINGSSIAESSTPGTYTGIITGGFSAGATITISANTSIGNVTGSALMPPGDSVTAPANGSTIDHTTLFNITWTGPTTGISAHYGMVYVSSPLVPTVSFAGSAAVASCLVPSNTLTAGSYFISAFSVLQMPLSNADGSSEFIIANSVNTYSITIN
jgi:hypothetical protein